MATTEPLFFLKQHLRSVIFDVGPNLVWQPVNVGFWQVYCPLYQYHGYISWWARGSVRTMRRTAPTTGISSFAAPLSEHDREPHPPFSHLVPCVTWSGSGSLFSSSPPSVTISIVILGLSKCCFIWLTYMTLKGPPGWWPCSFSCSHRRAQSRGSWRALSAAFSMIHTFWLGWYSARLAFWMYHYLTIHGWPFPVHISLFHVFPLLRPKG